MTQQDVLLPAEVTVPLRTVAGNPELALDVVPETLRPGALDRPVRWAHVSELADPAPYLVGAELVLTAGVNLPKDADRYVRGLRDAGVTALGFGLTPTVSETLPSSLRDACVEHGLPLLVVPPATPFLAINRAVAVALAEAGRHEERRLAEGREALTRAAGGGLGELVAALAGRLRGWVAMVGAGDVLAAGYDAPQPLPSPVKELLATLRARSGIRIASTELPDGTHVVAQPVYPQATAAHLVVAGRAQRFDSGDRAILAVGAALLGLVGRAGSDSAELGAAATALLLGGPGADALAGVVGSDQARLVAGVARRRGPDALARRPDWLRARLDTPLVQVLPGPRFYAIASEPTDLDGLLEHGWLAVASPPHPAAGLPAAVAETELLLARARALARPLAASADPLGFDDLIPPAAAGAFAERLLAPLRELDRAHGRELVPTLRTWLAHHGSWDRTAAELGVHRNSVRHRIGQAERALGTELADPETRMRLWFALRWG
ncbi:MULTISPECIES: PucR family transcriptional regulator [Amycolatopsis]|uniref:PucR family transcriptional regulator n=1 Tax=Amycolatopsis dendrobii TaxID=2760662 RepID=A0A7W3VUD8_9PSEU|nr:MULTISPECIES: PucR family transcriptional regulator [Amycolatopsis]MBB1153393.1 PucR family transcriptional regulator [Amycolatopsis dendrobii]UKD55758.1 PucR family transcriptional regulator [Amycolatopsis sp. FU40]